jgi:GTP-binding protein
MPVPKVAIVGRPNVGKSSLFNALAGKRIAIVEPTPGVTRDRLSTLVQADEDHFFELMDTGGMGIEDRDALTDDVERQIQQALVEADLVLFTVDARDGVVQLDELVAKRLRDIGKPVLLVVNKCDVPTLDVHAQEFHQLGFAPLLCVSAHQGRGWDDLKEQIRERLPAMPEGRPEDVELKLAIVGRRNTGKSTFINALAQEERVIVSEVPGTTRDSIDVRFERDGKTFIAIDTAGVKKKSSIADSIEFYSMARAERSIRRADVVLHFFDPEMTFSTVDKTLAQYIIDHHKPAIFVVNKWDLAKGQVPTEAWADYIRKSIPALDYVPIAFITAKEGKNVYRVLNLAQNLYKQASSRMTTGELNRLLREAFDHRPPPMRQNRQLRLFYGTQVAENPPTLVLFTNGPELATGSYERYLLRYLRDHSPFQEVPILIHWRKRGEDAPTGGKDRDEEETPAPKAARPEKPRRKTKKKPESDVWKDV